VSVLFKRVLDCNKRGRLEKYTKLGGQIMGSKGRKNVKKAKQQKEKKEKGK